MSKLLWADVETTGLNPVSNGIIQLAGIVEIDGVIKEEFNYSVRPLPGDILVPEALAVNGIKQDQLATFLPAATIQIRFCSLLKRYVNPYDKEDKFTFCGYNSQFDMRFLASWFSKLGDKYYYSYFEREPIDVFVMWKQLKKLHGIKTDNNKLCSVSTYFGLNTDFHDAMNDIKITREIFIKLRELYEQERDK